MDFVGPELDGNYRAVVEGGSMKFNRVYGENVPTTEARRLEFYVAWHDVASPGNVGPIENFGLDGAVASDTFSLDPDLNFDRLLLKVRLPKSMAQSGDMLILAVGPEGVIEKTLELALVEDPLDSSKWITEVPVLLYEDPDSDVNVAAVEALLPEGTKLLDPPDVRRQVTAFIGSTSNPAIKRADIARYRLDAVSQLYSHLPVQSAATFTLQPVGAISTPALTANWRLAYQTNANDSTPDIRMNATDPSGKLGAPSRVDWYVNFKFKAGNTSGPGGRTWNVVSQWHVLGDALQFDIAPWVVALESDQWVDALGPGDFEFFARAVIGANVFESNLVPCKIVGVNPGQNTITSFIDQLEMTEYGAVTSTMISRIQASIRNWMKSIAKHESLAGPYSNHLAWDQFERNNETAGIDIGFQRSVTANNQSYSWPARYGWPFVTFDNGYGILQLTSSPAYKNISRWKNNVYKGWLILTQEKLSAAVTYLESIAGRALTAADDPVLIREAVKRYNGGKRYLFQNGVFVIDPAIQRPDYVDKVELAGQQAGWLP